MRASYRQAVNFWSIWAATFDAPHKSGIVNAVPAPRLNYAAADPTDRLIASCLEEQEQARKLVLLLKLAFGIPASFLAPFIGACIAVSISSRWGYFPGFITVFALLSVTCIPLIYWRAMQHETDFLGEAASGLGITPDTSLRTSSYGDWEMRSTWLTWAAYADLFFWGPYIVLEAYRAWRGDRAVALESRARAIQIVKELWREEGGVPVAELIASGESRAAFLGAVKYLVYYEWVDLSDRKDRIWLLTESRERLDKQRSMPR